MGQINYYWCEENTIIYLCNYAIDIVILKWTLYSIGKFPYTQIEVNFEIKRAVNTKTIKISIYKEVKKYIRGAPKYFDSKQFINYNLNEWINNVVFPIEEDE